MGGEGMGGGVLRMGMGRRARWASEDSICLSSVCRGGAFNCSLADCQGEMRAAQASAGPSKGKARLP